MLIFWLSVWCEDIDMSLGVGLRLCFVAGVLASSLALSGCQGLSGNSTTNNGIQSINHIVFMAQENRSFDSYYGQLPAYWAANGYPAQQLDGLPANASNPSYDGTSTVAAFHVATTCIQDLSPSWDESHVDWNLQEPTSGTPAMNGFVYNAAKYAMNPPAGEGPIYDTAGIRAMGYYDWTDLNYYYFMASNFATSDRWFSPALSRTQINRMYLLAATSQGYAYPPSAPLTANTIFGLLQTAGISWKIYETDPNSTYLSYFQTFYNQYASTNVVPATQFLSDAQSGNLPSVALIEGGYNSGRDEHPINNVQTGANYVSSLINGLMASPSWKDTVFILTYDEAGGLYDHVPPQPTVNPDGIAPMDLQPGDICTTPGGANCDFNYTGFRVPMLVISPFTKKNYVSHTVADYTAILKFIETRFNLPNLNQRDQAQPDMTEYFDFQNVPWATPPAPPTQYTGGTCNYQNLQ
jgi:phospholipase C